MERAAWYLISYRKDETHESKERTDKYGVRRRGISEILLLGEENNITEVWDIDGKISVVFGKDERENQVDVNLKNTDYAGTVDGEHAVMNFSNGSWYIENLDSENGTKLHMNIFWRKMYEMQNKKYNCDLPDVVHVCNFVCKNMQGR